MLCLIDIDTAYLCDYDISKFALFCATKRIEAKNVPQLVEGYYSSL